MQPAPGASLLPGALSFRDALQLFLPDQHQANFCHATLPTTSPALGLLPDTPLGLTLPPAAAVEISTSQGKNHTAISGAPPAQWKTKVQASVYRPPLGLTGLKASAPTDPPPVPPPGALRAHPTPPPSSPDLNTPSSLPADGEGSVRLDAAQLRRLLTCPLCQADLLQPLALPCMHSFCTPCMFEVLRTCHSCPLQCGFCWDPWLPPRPQGNASLQLLAETLGPLLYGGAERPRWNLQAESFYPASFRAPTFETDVPLVPAPPLAQGTQRRLLDRCAGHCADSSQPQGLSAANYGDFFHTLLEIEHHTVRCAQDRERHLFRQQLFQFTADLEDDTLLQLQPPTLPSLLLRLPIPGLWEEMPKLAYGDRALVRATDGQVEFEGVVVDLKTSPLLLERRRWSAPCALLEMPPEFWRMFPEVETHLFHIRLLCAYEDLRFPWMHMAVDAAFRAFQEGTGVQLVAPPVQDIDNPVLSNGEPRSPAPPLAVLDTDLDAAQRRAVALVVAEAGQLWQGTAVVGNVAPVLITGPPGTGKTRVIVECVRQFLAQGPGRRTLVCCPSDAACDVVCARLAQHTVPIPGLGAAAVAAPRMVRLYAYQRSPSFLPIPEVQPYCVVETLPDGRQRYSLPTLQALLDCHVVVGTPLCAMLLRLQGEPPGPASGREAGPGASNAVVGHFHAIVMDEVPQAMEPEVLVALQLGGPRTAVVLCGDVRQLGPACRSPLAVQRGLGVSILERLACHATIQRQVELVEQYRGHPVLLHVASQLFYGSRLTTAAALQAWAGLDLTAWALGPRRRAPRFPFVFLAVQGPDELEPDTPCFSNPAEADYIAQQVVPSLLHANAELQHDRRQIGVIAPYRSQVVRIRKLLRKRQLHDVRVGTVEDYQGQEQRLVVLSVTRSSGKWLGWDARHGMGLFCPKRFNVAISRAQELLVIVGNPHLLVQDANWRALLQYCWRHGAVVGACPSAVCTERPIPRTPFLQGPPP